MSLASFADPTVAIEPPPQAAEFDLAMVQQMVSDPFGFGAAGGSITAPSAAADKSWTDIGTDLGRGFLKDLAGVFGAKITGGMSPSDPSVIAAAAAAKAEQQKIFLIVGGVGVAVVLGAILLKRK